MENTEIRVILAKTFGRLNGRKFYIRGSVDFPPQNNLIGLYVNSFIDGILEAIKEGKETSNCIYGYELE